MQEPVLFGKFSIRAFAKVLLIASDRNDESVLTLASGRPLSETIDEIRLHADALWAAAQSERAPKHVCEHKRIRNNQRARLYTARKRADSPSFRLICSVRAHVGIALRRRGSSKPNSLFATLGYSPADLIRHLSGMLEPGMTWDNYGPVWHVDHKKPVALFDFSASDPSGSIRECWALSNLQPLFAGDNLRKGAKYAH